MPSRHFRAGVVIAVTRGDGRVLAFERADVPGQWQLPQGGLEAGERPLEAAWRELGEETGLGEADVELVGEHPEWIVSEWPDRIAGQGARLGQVHRWFFFRIRDEAIEPKPDGREFSAWQWADPGWLTDQVVAFRQPGYAKVLGRGR